MPRPHETRTAERAALAMSVLALAVYLPRVCPAVMLDGDSPEMVAAGAVWGVPHAPGFPLYTAIIHLVMRLPLRELAWRANVTSALAHAATVGVVGAILARLTRSWAAVVAGALVLMLSRAFFLASLYAEVFPLNDLFFASVLFVSVGAFFAARRDPARTWPWLVALAVVAGIASAHQPIIALSAPAVLVTMGAPLVRSLRARPSRALVMGLCFAIPYAASYALLVIAASRDPALSWGDVHDARSLWNVMMRADYGGPFRASRHATGAIDTRLSAYAASLVESAGASTLLLAAAGAWLARKRTGIGMLIAFTASGPMLAAINPLFASPGEAARAVAERFVTMALVPLAILAALAVHGVDVLVRRRTRSPLVRVCLALLPAIPLAPSALRIDLGDDRLGSTYARDLVSTTTDGALVLLRGDIAVQAAAYECVVERACGGRIVLSPGELFIPWKRAQEARRHPEIDLSDVTSITRVHDLVARALAAGRAVYVMPDFAAIDPELPARYRFVPDGLLLRVFANDADVRAQERAFLSRATALANGDAGEGWTAQKSGRANPSFESAVIDAYVAARLNTARMAEETFGQRDLAEALRRGARAQER